MDTGGVGSNAFYWYQIFAQYSTVVEAQKCYARMGVSMGLDKSIQSAQLLGLGTDRNFVLSKQVSLL